MATKFYTHLVKAYEFMAERSKLNEYEERIFEGRLTEVFRRAGASSAYYSPLRKMLLSPSNDPCIEIRQRGNVGQPTIIRLIHEPPKAWKEITHGGLTAPVGGATIPVEVEGRLDRLEAWRESIREVNNLSEVLQDFENRLAKVEDQLAKERGKRENGKTKKV